MNQTILPQHNGQSAPAPMWMRHILMVAGIYNLTWGTFVIGFPLLPFQWARMEPPHYPEIWQCVGMIVWFAVMGSL